MKTELTGAERRNLGNVIALGGIPRCGNISQGANQRGSLRKSTLATLQRRGLIEFVGGAYYATSSGCIAFGPEVASIS